MKIDVSDDERFNIDLSNCLIDGRTIRFKIDNTKHDWTYLLFKSTNDLCKFISNNNAAEFNASFYENPLLDKRHFFINGNKYQCIVCKDINQPNIGTVNIQSLIGNIVKENNKIYIDNITSTVKNYSAEQILEFIKNKEMFSLHSNSFFTDELPSIKFTIDNAVISSGYKIKHYDPCDQDIFKTYKELFENFENNNEIFKDYVDPNISFAHFCKDTSVFIDNNGIRAISNNITINDKDINPCAEIKNNNKPDWFVNNLEEGLYQGLATSSINNLSLIILSILKDKNFDQESLKIIEKFLSSKLGFVFLNFAIGLLVNNSNIENKHINKISEKCMQNVSAIGVEQVINFTTNFILPSLLEAINSNKAIENYRVEELTENINDDLIEELELNKQTVR